MRKANQLLAALPADDFARLEGSLQPVAMEFKQVLHRPEEAIENVYFPESGFMSMVSEMAEQIVEVATVGNEGFLGMPIFLGSNHSTLTTLSQIPGSGLLLSAAAFRDFLKTSPTLFRLMQLYVQSLIHQIAQSAACNRAHVLERRCARWLLMSHDRVESDTFPLTQEFLGQMLGVHRPQVNKVAKQLSLLGLIRYSRGIITVLDRAGLEKLACECYGRVRDEHARLLG
ncbi:MAG: Crp/Fnr family transcriptional regulator [Candidatus Eremiobacteraeota bacterium]|nr:Crp/Fnr family transcriptional regulator [Candidatus Eremiobacteraeota bacterium]